MKLRRYQTFLLSILFSAVGTIAAMGGLIRIFPFSIYHPSRLFRLWFFCAVLWTVCFSSRHGLPVVSVLFAGGFLFWQRTGMLQDSVLSFIQTILDVFRSTYGISLFALPPYRSAAADMPLLLCGSLITACVCRTICRRKGTTAAVTMLSLPLLLSTAATDRPPDSLPLFWLLAVILLLLLTGHVRRESAVQGNRLVWLAALPVLLLLTAVFLLFPEGTYVDRSGWIRQKLHAYSAQIPEKLQGLELPVPVAVEARNTVDLAGLSGQESSSAPVMEVTDTSGGILYLRGQDFVRYNGRQWESGPERMEFFGGKGVPVGSTAIATKRTMDRLFLPYYPKGDTVLTQGRLENHARLTDYTLVRYAPTPLPLPEDQYLALPESTLSRAEAIVKTIPGSFSSTAAAAEAIGSYVRSSAGYDRLTGAMPPEAEDFALWFLEEADSGFCVHFATAAVVLLRSSGIPARYVTGYLAEAEAGIPVTVTADDAHAWAEYYCYSDQLWHILDATPSEAAAVPIPTQVPEAIPVSGEKHLAIPRVPILYTLAGFPAALTVLRRIRLIRRRYRRQKGSPNVRGLALWQECSLLGKLSREPVPEPLLTLAEKARFSQHQLSEEELGEFFAFRKKCHEKMRKKPLPFRLIWMYYYGVL